MKKGFSLIEVLIAIVITGILMSSIYLSLTTLLTGKDRIKKKNREIRKTYFALNLIKKDLANAYLTTRKGKRGGEDTHVTIFKGVQDSPVSHLTFTTINHVRMRADSKECDQTEIEYFGEEKDGIVTLYRRESSWVDDDPERGGNVYPVLDNFVSLTFSYYYKNDDEWKEEWDSSGDRGNMLPPKIKITLLVREEEDDVPPLKIETIVNIWKKRPYDG